MSQRNVVENISPSRRLKDRVSGGGDLSEATLAAIEKRVAVISNEYPAWARKEMTLMHSILNDNVPHPTDTKQLLPKIYHMAHDLRGQAGSFGFPLVSEIATSLCRFLEMIESASSVDETARVLCQTHVDAMSEIFRTMHKDMGTEKDREAVSGLKKAVEVYAKRNNLTVIE